MEELCMTFFKSIKKIMLLVNLIYIVIGYLLLAKGSACVELVISLLGYGLGIAGIFEVVRYFLIKIDERYKRNDFILGIALLALAIVVLICKYSLSDIATVALGIAIIVSAALKVQDAIDAKKIGSNLFGTYMILMIICIGLGALVIINFFYILDYRLLYISAGIGLLFSGLTDLLSNIYLAVLKTKYEKNKEFKPSDDQKIIDVEPSELVKEEQTTEENTSETKFTPIDADKDVVDVNPNQTTNDENN